MHFTQPVGVNGNCFGGCVADARLTDAAHAMCAGGCVHFIRRLQLQVDEFMQLRNPCRTASALALCAMRTQPVRLTADFALVGLVQVVARPKEQLSQNSASCGEHAACE